ncbi:ABC transporter permease [Nocardia blacklockiae]|uniref:ABC transporter permease n=1 Tax=Nocardia blacklockiae TaxID=480036 RepID=UPI0018944674|nr:FtsX-like permease family protein [Nocardia blacklockiae]MBF6169874.1 hypothetical protein [Nocardia blacklockiae]
MRRGGAVGLVVRALARAWRHRPIRLVAALAGGVGGVVMTVAVLTISVPVLLSARSAPIDAIAPDVVAVSAKAPAGLSAETQARLSAATGALTSRMSLANTNLRGPDRRFVPVRVVGVDAGLPNMLSGNAFPRVAPLGTGEVYLPRAWSAAQHIDKGDSIEIATPTGVRVWRVADLIDGDLGNSGAAAVMSLADLASAFDRGSAVDIVLLRAPGGAADDLGDRARAAAADLAVVGSPDRIFDSYSRIFRTPLLLIWMFLGIGVLTGAVVILLTWRLALADARPMLARMRLAGARTTDLLAGSGLVLVPIMVCSYAIGAVLGLATGHALDSIGTQLTNFTQQALRPGSNYPIPLLGGAMACAVMFGAAWLSGLSRLRRVTAIDAVTGRDRTPLRAGGLRVPLAVSAVSVVAAAAAIAWARRISAPTLSAVVHGLAGPPLILGAALLGVVLPVVAGVAVRTWSRRPGGLVVGRQLQVQWRRNAALATTFAIALVTSVAMSGASLSMRHELDASMARWTRADVYAQAAPIGQNLSSETFPASLAAEIRAVPGVTAVYSFSWAAAVVNGSRYQIWSLAGDIAAGTATRVLDGPDDAIARLTGDRIAVASNFARTQHVGIGDTLSIPTLDGMRSATVVAVLDDAASDGGAIFVGDDLFRRVAGDVGVYAYGATAAAEHRAAVTAELETLLAQRYPRAAVLDRDAYRAGVSSMLARLMSSFGVFSWVMYAVAAVVGTTTLASNIDERRRGLAVSRLVGASGRAEGRMLAGEASIIGACAWLVAAPCGVAMTVVMVGAQALQSGIVAPPAVPWPMLAAGLPVTLLTVAAALRLARRSAGSLPVAAVLADE